jgi:hypothetical protein
VVLVGSLFQMGEMLIAPLREVIHSEAPYARLIRLSVPPVVGGILLAMDLVGINPALIRQSLVDSTLCLVDDQS